MGFCLSTQDGVPILLDYALELEQKRNATNDLESDSMIACPTAASKSALSETPAVHKHTAKPVTAGNVNQHHQNKQYNPI